MSWIQPLNMQTWLMQVFAGKPDIFLAIALMSIVSMASYFRMSAIGMFLMVGIFMLMFQSFFSSPIITIMAIISGLLVGYWLQKLFSR